jgi:hypothetical protein
VAIDRNNDEERVARIEQILKTLDAQRATIRREASKARDVVKAITLRRKRQKQLLTAARAALKRKKRND